MPVLRSTHYEIFHGNLKKARPRDSLDAREIQQRVAGKLNKLTIKCHAGPQGVFIQGAPGAGKSALLQHLADNHANDGTTVVTIDGIDLNDPLTLMETFFLSINGADLADRYQPQVRKHGRPEDTWRFSHGESRKSYRAPFVEMLRVGANVWSLIASFIENPERHTFLLLIDEAQRISPEQNKKTNDAAVRLHDGNTASLTVLPVFAGLSDTITRLAEVGISRTAEPFTSLRGLNDEETAKASSILPD